ncbi:hypothetical protein BKA70DRAFT_1447931 [Coprinopsis sp. MPI-PUGE-AT-0042]|nr:hypothetical protein BKA70DRAFT_1447931 [Coprinopsis sp. MPI-PUGE-AT-0042]
MKKAQVDKAVTIARCLLAFNNLAHVTGLLFPTHAFKPLLVPVPFHRGFSHRRRLIDLHVDLYIPESGSKSTVSEIRFLRSRFTLTHQGVVFNYYLVRPKRQIHRPYDNFLIMWLAQDDTVPADGDLLLVKADDKGNVWDILEDEIEDVQKAMIKYVP